MRRMDDEEARKILEQRPTPKADEIVRQVWREFGPDATEAEVRAEALARIKRNKEAQEEIIEAMAEVYLGQAQRLGLLPKAN